MGDALTLSLKDLNELPTQDLAIYLRRCCSSEAWVSGMVKRRPFSSIDALLREAATIWQGLGELAYLEAFLGHPKIGDVSSLKKKYADTHALASNEQSGAAVATTDVIQELADLNTAYEEKFGFIFIVFATGKSAKDMLETLKERLPNKRDKEIQNAADNQQKITELRLKKLLGLA